MVTNRLCLHPQHKSTCKTGPQELCQKETAKFLIISLWQMEEAPEDVTGGMPITTASKLK